MKAEKFSTEFLKKFDAEFEKSNFDYIENDIEIVKLRNFTNCINKIMELIANGNNLQLKREFLDLDYVFFQKKSRLMLIAVEHENYINRRKRNFYKLINTIAPLKVLICYYDAEKEDGNKILNYYGKLYKKLFPKTSNEFLMMIGKVGLEDSQDYLKQIF